MTTMFFHAVTLLFFVVAASSTVCARLTRPDRNYYPMQRVIWAVLGFVYGGSALARVFQSPSLPPGRVALSGAFSLAVLAATTYSIVFMRRRNTTARFVPLDVAGNPVMVQVEDLRVAHTKTTSYLRHGAMPAAWVGEIDDARAKWQEIEDWRGGVTGDVARRRAQKGGD